MTKTEQSTMRDALELAAAYRDEMAKWRNMHKAWQNDAVIIGGKSYLQSELSRIDEFQQDAKRLFESLGLEYQAFSSVFI